MLKKIKERIKNVKPPRRKLLRVFWEAGAIYDAQRVPRSAAALSYFVIIALFPIIIIATRILAGLNISEEQIIESFGQVIPEQITKIVLDFLGFVRNSD